MQKLRAAFAAMVVVVLAIPATFAQTTAGTGTTIVVPITAQTGSFASEVTVFNPNGVAITVDVQYFDANNVAPPAAPGPKTCADVVVPANRSVQFSLVVQCTLGDGSHFGLLVLTDLAGTNPFYGYARVQNPQGIGFSVEGFPAGNFNDQLSHATGLKKTTAGLIFQTNCFVGSLAQAVSYTLKLFDDTTGAQIGNTVSGSLAAFQQLRYLDIFGPAGVNAANVDQFNVRAEFASNPPATLVGFCTVQDNSSFGADFRIAKSYGTTGTVTNLAQGTGIVLTPSPITSTGTIAADTTYLQRRVSGTCAAGSSIRVINDDGTVSCETDDGGGAGSVTSLTPGTGITLTPNPITTTGSIAVNTAAIQARISGTCSAGSSIRVIDAAGAVTCQTDSTGPANAFVQNGNAFGATAVFGTTDNFALDIRANNARVMRYEPNSISPNVIGGSPANSVKFVGVLRGVTIAGGGAAVNSDPVEADEAPNYATDFYSTIGGGYGNTAGNDNNNLNDSGYATVGGGRVNIASGRSSTVGGGEYNGAIGEQSAIAGGGYNTASGINSAVGGGGSNSAVGDYSTVGGGQNHSTGTGSHATISGGNANTTAGNASTVGGGESNQALAFYSVVGGGKSNVANDDYSTLGGGNLNSSSLGATYSTVAGGYNNAVVGQFATTIGGGASNQSKGYSSTVAGGFTNLADGDYSTVAGGALNTASGVSSMVAGGASNQAIGGNSIVMGYRAIAQLAAFGSFVFGDGTTADCSTDVANKFLACASGGFELRTSKTLATGCSIAAGGGAWTCSSSRDLKRDFLAVDSRWVLDQVVRLPMTSWRFVSEASGIRHLGPTAQDFHAAFGLNGDDDRGISTVDAQGVALAAIQGLNAKLEAGLRERDATIALQALRQAGLERQIVDLAGELAEARTLRADLVALKASLAELHRQRHTVATK